MGRRGDEPGMGERRGRKTGLDAAELRIRENLRQKDMYAKITGFHGMPVPVVAFPQTADALLAVALQVVHDGQVHDVGVDLGGAHALVSQQPLHRGDVDALIY